MSQATALELLKEGIAAARAGNKALTRQLLREVTELDPRNEVAWLWYAGVADSPHESLTYLQRVLEINPTNERAKAGIKAARLQAGIVAAKARDRDQARRLLRQVTADDPATNSAGSGSPASPRRPRRPSATWSGCCASTPTTSVPAPAWSSTSRG